MLGTPCERVARCREKSRRRKFAIAQGFFRQPVFTINDGTSVGLPGTSSQTHPSEPSVGFSNPSEQVCPAVPVHSCAHLPPTKKRARSLMDFPREVARANRRRCLARMRYKRSFAAGVLLPVVLPLDKMRIDEMKDCYPERSYKPVENDLMLFFSKWTKVEEVIEVPLAFPELVYNIASMEQIQSRVDGIKVLTDVIRVITSVSKVESIQTRVRPGESLRRNVMIRLPSGDPLKVVLWAERAASFPAEEVHSDGQNSPQIVMFVGTLVRSYGGFSLSGGPSCKWYIDPQVPEAKSLMNSARAVHQSLIWADGACSSRARDAAGEMKISDIKILNPFECKKYEYLVTVTIRKIDRSWWYNACKKCIKTAKRHGDSYKCTNSSCGTIGTPVQRYKLCILAGDETGDTNFIVFGRIAQRLTKRTADALLASNPAGFIPDEITKLLERTFIWNVSFTDSTIETGNVTFQVSSVVAEIDDGSAVIPATPAGSQSSSLMLSLSKDASPSVQSTPGKRNPLTLSSMPAASDASLASSTTPSKLALPAPESMETPQKDAAADEDGTVTSAAGMPADVPDCSSTKNQKSGSKKRTRHSPDKKVSKALFPGKEAGDGADDLGSGADAAAGVRPSGSA